MRLLQARFFSVTNKSTFGAVKMTRDKRPAADHVELGAHLSEIDAKSERRTLVDEVVPGAMAPTPNSRHAHRKSHGSLSASDGSSTQGAAAQRLFAATGGIFPGEKTL